MSRSAGVSWLKGTSVRTPISRATCFMRSHMSMLQGATAPSSMASPSSGTSESRSTVRTMPVPSHSGQAPPLLKARSSAPGPKNSTPQTGHAIGRSAATFSVGGTRWPFGHTWLPARENSRRRLFSSSVDVPKVLRTPGTLGRWCRASAAGTCSTSSTEARPACVRRRRV